MKSFLRLAASAAVALALAAGISFALAHRPVPPGPTGPSAVASMGAHAGAPTGEDGSREPEPGYRLKTLPVVTKVVLAVQENYVDPRRVNPRSMLAGSLGSVEKTVAEVMVEGDVGAGKVKVTVGEKSRDFDVSDVNSIFSFRQKLAEIMDFVQDNLVAHKNLGDVEYAAANGMLQTLDPHSVLLEPKHFKEMRLQTRGEFGGLGFVIGVRDGNLTVMKVLKNTPAQRAGIRAKDVISRIEEQSTINMDVQEAVDRLRGKPGTRVNVTVGKPGAEPRRLAVVREVINVETVPFAKLLDKNVGYVKVAQFSANTTRDIQRALEAQKAEAAAAGGKLEGLILDLRGNPGGLLEQAISVSDLFLSEGVIVKTVGEGDRRQIHEVKEAKADRNDYAQLPLVVLVNNASASASEIVAGALKNNGRALVAGRQTFGKGSVQVLYDFSDPAHAGEEAALKLTIAQYLTPGDVSIQEVGITPDVHLQPGRALPDAVNWFAPPRSMGEADLDHHFKNPLLGAEARKGEPRKVAEKPPLELRYLLDEKEDFVAKALKKEAREEARKAGSDDPELTPAQLEDEEADANPDELVEDYQIRFAKDLLARAPYPDRARQLEAARGLVEERRAQEQERLQARFAQLGVDWSAGAPSKGTPRPVATFSPADGKPVKAGETVPWVVTVKNEGDAPVSRLRGWTRTENAPFLDRREFVFGAIPPGGQRSWTVPLRVPKGMESRLDLVTLHLEDDSGATWPDTRTRLEVVELPRPLFAFTWQADDEARGDGDGLLGRGEEVALRVDVRNAGSGPSGDKTFVSLKNLGDDKVFIKKGRAVLGAIPPGETRSAVLELEVKKGIKLDAIPLRLTVVDEKLEEYVSEKLEIPLSSQVLARQPASGSVKVQALLAPVRSGAAATAPVLAEASRGAVLPVNARVGEFYRVEWEKGRFGFVAADEVQPAKGKREGTITRVWQREPPRIAVSPDTSRGPARVDGERMKLTGTASIPPGSPSTRIRDLFVFVNDQKVFFKVVPEGKTGEVAFEADVPLKPGNNTVTVVAREDEEFQSRRTLTVHRREPAEVAQQK
ncbi:MAG TPA: MXAN_5808 family serine peptidase [Anaeromyxobacteraceae bacterium]|nr:MXAN_5808 family serine peptidase [Anaeromyxobacteraceae bacterium]